MTNNQLTKEWLQQTIAELESVRDEIPFGIDTNSELELAAFKLALTAMDSEPVAYAWVSRSGKKHLTRCEPEQWRDAVILTPLYRHAQPVPVPAKPVGFINDAREPVLYGEHIGIAIGAQLYAVPQPAPVVPDGYVMVPMRLTAENGAKGALSGEFSETKFVNCPECFGDDECETCDGSGRIEIKVPVSWTTIKEIWIKSVEHFAAAPQENN